MMNKYRKYLSDNLVNSDMGLLKDFLARGQLIAAGDQIQAEMDKIENNIKTLGFIRRMIVTDLCKNAERVKP